MLNHQDHIRLEEKREPTSWPRPRHCYREHVYTTKAWEFGASAIINYKGIEAGPEFSSVSKVKMEVIYQGADAFQVLKLRVWLENPENRKKVSQACMEEFQESNTYMITEAFRVSKG